MNSIRAVNFTLILVLMTLTVLACNTELTESELRIAIKNSLNTSQPCPSFQLNEIKIAEIGNVQNEDSSKWWPVRASISGQCIHAPQLNFDAWAGIDNDSLSGDSLKLRKNVVSRDSTFTLDYKVKKDRYFDEWIATKLYR